MTPPPYGQPFVISFFGVHLTLEYDYMNSEADFTQEKNHFHPTTRIPNSSLLFAPISQKGWTAEALRT